MEKSIIIIRGASSAGKTSFANLIPDAVICSADDYFYDDHGNYNWDASKLSYAHALCRDKFDEALKDDTINNIVIANVNSKPSEWSYYETQGKKAGIL
jgi:uridine kinase